MGETDFLSVKEVAEMKGVSVRRVHQLIEDGSLKAEKIGAYYAVKKSEAEKLTVYGKAGRPPKEKEKK